MPGIPGGYVGGPDPIEGDDGGVYDDATLDSTGFFGKIVGEQSQQIGVPDKGGLRQKYGHRFPQLAEDDTLAWEVAEQMEVLAAEEPDEPGRVGVRAGGVDRLFERAAEAVLESDATSYEDSHTKAAGWERFADDRATYGRREGLLDHLESMTLAERNANPADEDEVLNAIQDRAAMVDAAQRDQHMTDAQKEDAILNAIQDGDHRAIQDLTGESPTKWNAQRQGRGARGGE